MPLGGKTVVILPDNDAPGHKYAETVADLLARLTPAPVVKIVKLPGLPPKGDLVEWIEAHGDAAEPETMRQELERMVEETKAASPRTAGKPRSTSEAIVVRLSECVNAGSHWMSICPS
jgi:putative DNA primase/helicase